MSRLSPVRLAACAFACASFLVLPAGDAVASVDLPGEVLATGLDNPRGIVQRGSTTYVAEAGKGGTGPCLERQGAAPACLGATGAVTAVRGRKARRILTGLPSLAPADGTSAIGPADVARRGSRIFTVLGLGAQPAARDGLGALGGRLGWLFEARNGRAVPVADLAGHQGSVLSNPFGVTNVGKQLYVADAGADSVVVVKRDGKLRTKATIPAHAMGPRGARTRISAAPSAVGDAGKRRIYVTEQSGFPFPKNQARVLRISGGGRPATVFAGKFTNLVDIVPAGFGSLYVLERSQGRGAGRRSGRVLHMEPGGAVRHILATNLPSPGGMAVDPLSGKIYVTLNSDRPGKGALVRLEGHGSHASVGTPQGYYPNMTKTTMRGLAEGRRIMRATLAQKSRFTFRRARRMGFRYTTGKRPVGAKIFHLRKDAWDSDGREMDPRRPESLVFYNTSKNRKILVAFMYRAETQRFPRLTRGLLGWHRHGATNRALPMTHVWMTRDLRGALANCLPVRELEASLKWTYEGNDGPGSGLESLPCLPPETRPPGE